MWGRRKKPEHQPDENRPQRLRDALRQARIESAERSGVVVDMRDAEAARLELLNDALDPLYAEIPDDVELFDRAVSHGDPPRLWVDAVAHVHMGRDKRTYRLVQDSRNGRKLLAESPEIEDIAGAITQYIARRILDREQALAADERPLSLDAARESRLRRQRRWRTFRAFVFGLFAGIAVVIGTAWLLVRQVH